MILSAIVWGAAFPAPAPKGGLRLPSGEVAVFGSEQRAGHTELVMNVSLDGGRTWQARGTVAVDPRAHADLGDGTGVLLRNGRIWVTYRHNVHGPNPKYAIEVAESVDKGLTWRAQPVVESVQPEGSGPSRGLWAPFLLAASNGQVQCYYDNEYLPWKSGFAGHQWITMRSWDGQGWSQPVVVAKEAEGLSRDGMASVVETSRGHLLCAVEAVREEAPHAGLLKMVSSGDGGKTWTAPAVLYAPADSRFHAFAPSMVQLGRRFVVVFCTNEDRSSSPPSGTPADRMSLDVKAIESVDGGRSWSVPSLVYAGTHRNYLPSAVPTDRRTVFVSFLDFDRGPLAVAGEIPRK